MKLLPTQVHLIAVALFLAVGDSEAAESLYEIEPDLIVPNVESLEPAAGRRVNITTSGWEGTEVHHSLYLPTDWKPEGKFPVLVEYAGNGGYSNALGDVSLGTVEGTKLGYGLSGGSNFVWVSMPFVAVTNGTKVNARNWWGDVAETRRYCIATVADVCAKYEGDTNRVILCGFSRGAIACNFIGLNDDEIAKLWRGFFCHSHYDGVRTGWPYAGADCVSALLRLKRLGNRPQWISHEGGGVAETQHYIESTGVKGRFTFIPLPFPNHSDAWVLRNLPIRDEARTWLRNAVK